MNAKKSDLALCLLFALGLSTMALLFWLLPARSYSPLEKRYLAPAPALNAQELLSGRFADSAERYYADHLPGRDFWVGLNAYFDLLTGRQRGKDVLLGRSGSLYERPKTWDEAAARGNMDAINAFAASLDCPVTLMLVPSAGYVLAGDLPPLCERYADGEMIEMICAMAEEPLCCCDLLSVFAQAPEPAALYYGTDHHWTSRGAYTACRTYLESRGRVCPDESDYTIRSASGSFRGSTYARSALWLQKAERVELWDSGGRFTVRFSEKEGSHEGLFFTERLDEDDQYTVFLDGNHSLVFIDNAAPAAEGTLLVVRDSFANCLGRFLADNYRRVILVDLRYYKNEVSALCAAENVDEVLAVYSLGNFLTDSNLVWLR